jgi:hypothetical protein
LDWKMSSLLRCSTTSFILHAIARTIFVPTKKRPASTEVGRSSDLRTVT